MKAWYVFLILSIIATLHRILSIALAKRYIIGHNKSLLVKYGRKPELILSPNKTRSLIVLVLWVFWLVLFVAEK